MAILSILTTLCLAACSGLRGKADALYEKGAYFEAIQTYELALQEHPGDEEALAGLKKARTTYFDKKLIEVRKARMGTNRQLAIDILLELVSNQNAWKFYPGGALANTQEEETMEAVRFVEFLMREGITKDRPLWSLYLLQHYQPIFGGGLAGRREFLIKELGKSGRKQCDALARVESPKQPYFSEFVRKVCSAWGVAGKGKAGAAAKRAELYGSLQVSSQIHGFPRSFRSVLNGPLERAFQQTPWYDSEAPRALRVAFEGTYHLTHERNPERRAHGYTVSIPYTDYQTVTKTRSVPYSDTRRNCRYDSVTRKEICDPSGSTSYRTESYTEKEPVTRQQQVPKTQYYEGIQHLQVIDWRLEGTLSLAGQSQPLRLDAHVQREGFEHHFNLPSIGLYPEKPRLENPEAWVQQQADLLASDLRSQAEDMWDNLYCQPTGTEATLVATGDRVHRCLRHRFASPPPFTDSWYDRFFGLTVAQADELLKLSDL